MKLLPIFEELKIRNKYEEHGVDGYYSHYKDSYVNPHYEDVKTSLDWVNTQFAIGNFLDLGCGNGEVSLYLEQKGLNDFEGCDPHFSDIYEKKTGRKCYTMSFEEIAIKGLPNIYNTIICSYSIHLCDKSYFKQLLFQLGEACEHLVIIGPNKNPQIDSVFQLDDMRDFGKVNCRIYSIV
jgi:2-polyprenyl-3-methyl-5-hydroxy-6-metoxy-1,4-benzoquinol methylase